MNGKQTKILLGIILMMSALAAYFVFCPEKNGASMGAWSQQSLESKIDGYAWEFKELETDENGTPYTGVALIAKGKVYAAGVYAGSCHEVKSNELGVMSEEADAGEVSRVQCWFAGGGDEIGVFEENEKMYIKVGVLGEGDDETPPFRGNFNTLLEL